MKKILIALSFLVFGTYANADCNIKSGSINILANDFPALRTLVETAKECKGSADFKVTHSAEHNKIAVPALTCLLYTSPSPRDRTRSRMPSSA